MKLTNLKTKYLGKNTIHYQTIDSTQSEIWRLIEQNSPNGTLVMADIQTQGQGTHGRIWHTDESNNIAFSFFVKPECAIRQLDGITIRIAEIILEIMKRKYRIELEIKEPNDIVFHHKKIGGILTQTKLIGEQTQYLVIGIGLNTAQEKFNDDIKDIATSIKNEFNIEINVCEFICEFCNSFEKILENLCS